MQKQLAMVAEFHQAFGLATASSPEGKIDPRTWLLRYKLMREENEEYLDAAEAGDLEQVADALGDMLYILCGTILSHGLQSLIEEVFAEIQRSNLSKLGEDGKPLYREDGKVLKGPQYRAPRIGPIIARAQKEGEG